MRLSIKTKIVLAIGIPLLVTYLGMLWCEYYLGKREALAHMESHLTELAARQAAELNGDLSTSETVARTLAMLVTSTPDLSADQIKAWLQDCLLANPDVFGMCVAFEHNAWSGSLSKNGTGSELAGANPAKSSGGEVPVPPFQQAASDPRGFAPYCCRAQPTGLRYVDIADVFPDYTSLHWYRPAKLTNRPFWTEPYFDQGVGERMMCTYSVPFFHEGKFRGVVTVDVLANDVLAKDILDRIPQIKIGSGYCILISKNGTFISHPDPSLILQESIFSLAKRYNIDELADAGRQMVAGKTGVCRIPDYHTGLPKWMVFAPVKSSEWSLAAIIPEKEVLEPIYARLKRSLGILVLGCILMLGIVLLVAIHVTRPINRLAEATESLAHGNLDISVPGVTGNDEVAQLARRFNAMVVELKTNIEDRIREEAVRKEMEGELAAAREIQAALLPRMLPPDKDRKFSLHAVNAPAKMVAGDFFDFFLVDPRKLAVVMSDVSGKGVPAAVYMAAVRTRLRDFASPDKTPAEIITEVNQSLAKENDQNMFATLFFGYYDIDTGELTYVNAGHCPPYLVRQNGLLETLEPTGPLVAAFPDAVFHDSQCRLEPQELLVLYTDGVTEAMSEDGQLFGEKRLERLLPSLKAMPIDEACLGVVQAASQFTGGELGDDATVLVLRRNI